jgi:hypothetical protein
VAWPETKALTVTDCRVLTKPCTGREVAYDLLNELADSLKQLS